jgi:uncharacterized protein
MADRIKPTLVSVSPAAANDSPGTVGGRCSICRRPTVHEFRPFCSRRCADVDLSRWLTGAYAVAGGGADADEDGEGTADLPEPAEKDKL